LCLFLYEIPCDLRLISLQFLGAQTYVKNLRLASAYASIFFFTEDLAIVLAENGLTILARGQALRIARRAFISAEKAYDAPPLPVGLSQILKTNKVRGFA
jgi:ABC-type dipeptide/oligopeptide/nickel transport system permease subunit